MFHHFLQSIVLHIKGEGCATSKTVLGRLVPGSCSLGSMRSQFSSGSTLPLMTSKGS
jgi:hypothetical protein